MGRVIMDALLLKGPSPARCWVRLLAASSEIKAIVDFKVQRLVDCSGL